MLSVRRFNVETDSVDKIAELMSSQNASNCPLYSADKEIIADALKKLMPIKGTECSAENFWICDDEDGLHAVMQMCDPFKINIKKSSEIFANVLNDRKFVPYYKKWKQFTRPLQSIGSCMYIQGSCYEKRYKLKCSNLFIRAAVNHANSLHHTCLFTDVSLSDEISIDFLKKSKFTPVRVMVDNNKNEFVRMTRSIMGDYKETQFVSIDNLAIANEEA